VREEFLCGKLQYLSIFLDILNQPMINQCIRDMGLNGISDVCSLASKESESHHPPPPPTLLPPARITANVSSVEIFPNLHTTNSQQPSLSFDVEETLRTAPAPERSVLTKLEASECSDDSCADDADDAAQQQQQQRRPGLRSATPKGKAKKKRK